LLQQLKPFENQGKQKNKRVIDYLMTTKTATKQLSLFKHNITYQFTTFLTKIQKKSKKQNWQTNKLTKSNFSLLSPKLIATFICALLNKNSRFKNDLAAYRVSPSIPMLLTRLLAPFKKEICGVKVICSGRWKKTKSGRKQKLCIKYGKIRKPTMTNIILFDYITQKTKFGACGIKV
jgi:ribosomal protein S3